MAHSVLRKVGVIKIRIVYGGGWRDDPIKIRIVSDRLVWVCRHRLALGLSAVGGNGQKIIGLGEPMSSYPTEAAAVFPWEPVGLLQNEGSPMSITCDTKLKMHVDDLWRNLAGANETSSKGSGTNLKQPVSNMSSNGRTSLIWEVMFMIVILSICTSTSIM
ncbi:hypothetical protein OSB04_001369 [Centaurea solstitialis]|uniref:Uncharacterized protein n=1 Tax=Centaurea solstitialis TaxID=347529 RepID=A0AA38U9X0_9ASTR|nr:hypothetical protein OSB04_001369 [Centaurea solstitialis]